MATMRLQKSEFSKSLKSFLRSAKMNQCQLAERAGLTPAAISQYLAGEREPTLRCLLLLCKALGITPNDLLGYHADKQDVLQQEVLRLRNKIGEASEVLRLRN